MFRRPLRRMIIASNRPAAMFEQVNQAEDFLASGHPDQAAAIYDQLAETAQQRGRFRHAAIYRARAAHAWLDAGNQTLAQQRAKEALLLYKNSGSFERADLFQLNFEKHIQLNQTQGKKDPVSIPVGHAGGLPSTCPQCGAPLRSDEVQWIDSQSAECDFCGAVLHTL